MTNSLKQAATDALLMLEQFRETDLAPTSEEISIDALESTIDSLQEAIENTVLTEAEPINIGIDPGAPEGDRGVEATYIDGVLFSLRDSRKTNKPILQALERCYSDPILLSVQQMKDEDGLPPQDVVTIVGTFCASLLVRAAHRNATAFTDAQAARAYISRYCVNLTKYFMEGVKHG